MIIKTKHVLWMFFSIAICSIPASAEAVTTNPAADTCVQKSAPTKNVGFSDKGLQNGSFEDGLVHWRQWWPKGRLGKIESDGSIGRNGRQCAKILMNDQKGSRLSFSQSIEINSKNIYELTFSFYTSSTKAVNATVRLGAADKNGQHIGYFCKKQLTSTANVWVDYKLIFNPPAKTDKVTVEFNFMGPLECWLDYVKFNGVDPATQTKMAALNTNPNPVFKELLIPGSAPVKPRVFPYWGYNNDYRHYRSVALRYGWQFNAAEQYEECAKFNWAPFSAQWRNREFVKEFSMPTTSYLVITAGQKCWKDALKNGAQISYPGRPNPNAPIFVQTCLDNIARGLFVEQPVPVFYFFYDEMYNQNRKVVKKEERKSEYWRTADAVVREKYGFGKIGIPDSNKDVDPFKRIAYMRWQADLSADTFKRIGAKLKETSPDTLFMGPDEFASFCPQDWERIGEAIDIQPGQALATASGYRRFNPGYLVKFYRDLTGKPVYPLIQTVKYGASPSIETLYDWVNQSLRSGGEGLFICAVEWFDREINHSKYAAPRKWAALLDISKTLQKMEKVRLPADKSMALHFGSYTQMSREHPPQDIIGSAFAMLGPRAKSWFTFTDDFQIDRDIKRWDDFKVVVIADAKYISRNMMKAVSRFVENGGTIVVTDPEAFSFALDGEDLTDFRKKLFGASIAELENNNTIIIDGEKLPNPSSKKTFKIKIVNEAKTKTLARFVNGSPAIIEHQSGRGRVWLFAFNPFTDASVDDIVWIEQWRNWLTSLNIPLNHKIWRFALPMEKLAAERKDKCLTGNAVRYRQNFPEVSMNIELPGNYAYITAPKNIPEKITDEKISFKKGLLTNRRDLLKLKRKANGSVVDAKQNAVQNWVVRFGEDESAANSIIIDLSKPCRLTQCALVFSGTLPDITIEASKDNSTWTTIGSIASQNASEDVLKIESVLSGEYRWIRLNSSTRQSGTTLTLAELEIWGNI